jgi:hypothetical protein
MQSGVLPPFVPFAQALAAVLTAILTGSLYYVVASPKGYFFLYPIFYFPFHVAYFSFSLFSA